MQEHADKEKEQERDAVEEEDVRDVGDVGGGKEVHLFLRGAEEEEAGCVEELVYKSAFEQRVDFRSRGFLTKVLTKGVRYWKLLVSSTCVSDIVFWSRRTNEISTILAAPAAISVEPKTVWTCVLNSRS